MGAAVSVSARSAEAVTVVVTLAALLPGIGSASLAMTETLFVINPAAAACGRTVIVAVTGALFARMLPKSRATWEPLTVNVPCDGATDTTVTLAGNVSVATTLLAESGPRSVTVTTYWSRPPTATGFGAAVTPTDRSAVGAMRLVSVAELFGRKGSP